MAAEIQNNGYHDLDTHVTTHVTWEDRHDPEEENLEDGLFGTDIYHNEIKGIKLLDCGEEIALSQRIQAGQEALRILAGSPEDISQEEVDKLNRTIMEGKSARETFIVSNLKLARARANQYLGRGVDLDDLVQEANIGLTRAVDKFDWKRGCRFSTYAYWWINQAIIKALADQGNLVRIPGYVNDLRIKIWKHRNNFFKLYGKNPTDEELALMTGIVPKLLERAKKSYFQVRYLSEMVGDDDKNEEELGELLPSNLLDPAREAEEELNLERTRQVIQQACSSLSPQQQAVIKLRFGLDENACDGERTLEDVGREMGKTRERIRQIQARAMSKLRFNGELRAIAAE